MANEYDIPLYDEETFDDTAGGSPLSNVTVEIGGTDRTGLIYWHTFRLLRALTSQIDVLNFDIKRYGSKTFKPALLDEVSVYEGTTKIFGGNIVTTNEAVQGAKYETYSIIAKDNAHIMDARNVVESYEDKTVDFIVNDIITKYLPAGFTGANVNAPVNVGFIQFNYQQPSKCFQRLAELVGYDWYVDVDKDINFNSKTSTSAPFNLTDTNGKYFFDSLRLKKDIKNIRNVIIVRGGEFSGSSRTEVHKADGERSDFDFGFKYKNATWRVDRGSGFAAESFGADNLTDPTTVDWLYNFQEKTMKLASGTKPSATDIVEIGGLPQTPVIILAKDPVSIAEHGEVEHKIIEKSIKTRQGARDRAKQEMIRWATLVQEGTFVTVEPELNVGQLINIQSTLRGIDESFIITRINSKLKTPFKFEHTVTLVTTQLFGSIEFLQKLLMDKDSEIEIQANEVIDKIEAPIESIVIAEAVAVSTDNNPQTESIVIGEASVATIDSAADFVYAPFPIPTASKLEGAYGGAVYA